MKFNRYFLPVVLLCTPVLSVLLSCEKQYFNKSVSPAKQVEVTTYDQKGLKIVHPVDWTIDYDGPGIYSDRAVAFETEDLSRITVFFYKKDPRNISEQADRLARELKLEISETVKNYRRSAIEIGGYKGMKLSWKRTMLVDMLIEITILQVRSKPFPVFVNFHFFDDDIELKKVNILPFSDGISFDPQGIEL